MGFTGLKLQTMYEELTHALDGLEPGDVSAFCMSLCLADTSTAKPQRGARQAERNACYLRRTEGVLHMGLSGHD